MGAPSILVVVGAPPALRRGRGGQQEQAAALDCGPPHEQLARVNARGAGRLVSGIVLVEQDEGRGRGQRHEERRAGADDDAGAAAGRREPRRAPGGWRLAAVEPRGLEASGPSRRRLPVGRDHERRARPPQRADERRVSLHAHPELGLDRGAGAHRGRRSDWLARAPERHRRHERQEGRPQRREALLGRPPPDIERGLRQNRRRLHRALEGPQPRGLPLADGHHHPHPRSPLQGRAHPLPHGNREAFGHGVGEGPGQRYIEYDVGNHARARGRGHRQSRRAPLSVRPGGRILGGPASDRPTSSA